MWRFVVQEAGRSKLQALPRWMRRLPSLFLFWRICTSLLFIHLSSTIISPCQCHHHHTYHPSLIHSSLSTETLFFLKSYLYRHLASFGLIWRLSGLITIFFACCFFSVSFFSSFTSRYSFFIFLIWGFCLSASGFFNIAINCFIHVISVLFKRVVVLVVYVLY